MRLVALILTLALHLIVGVALIQHERLKRATQEEENLGKSPNLVDTTIIFLPSKGVGFGSIHCESYRGIGILTSWDDNNIIVLKVAPQSPAEEAGILVDDRILNPEVLGVDRYEPGHEIILQIKRNGVIFVKVIKIGHICFVTREDRPLGP